MLYVPFLAEKNGLKKLQQGDHKCASGGGVSGVWSKTIKLPFFLGPFPKSTRWGVPGQVHFSCFFYVKKIMSKIGEKKW